MLILPHLGIVKRFAVYSDAAMSQPSTRPTLYKGYRFPAEIISRCVWLYCRFGVRYRGHPRSPQPRSAVDDEAQALSLIVRLVAQQHRELLFELPHRRPGAIENGCHGEIDACATDSRAGRHQEKAECCDAGGCVPQSAHYGFSGSKMCSTNRIDDRLVSALGPLLVAAPGSNRDGRYRLDTPHRAPAISMPISNA
jgi:hypothetical protein